MTPNYFHVAQVTTSAVVVNYTPDATDNIIIIGVLYPTDQGGSVSHITIDGVSMGAAVVSLNSGTWQLGAYALKITPGASSRALSLLHSVSATPWVGGIVSYKVHDPDSIVTDAATSATRSLGEDPVVLTQIGISSNLVLCFAAIGMGGGTNAAASGGATLQGAGQTNYVTAPYTGGDGIWFGGCYITSAATVSPGFTRPSDDGDPSGNAIILTFGITLDTGPVPIYDQYSFRGVNDDGSESGSTFKDALNTNYTIALDTNFRLRILTRETDT